MNQWYFSKNGTISGPFDFTAAKKYVLDNHDVYGWHPSFVQWKPLSTISEFSGLIPAPVVNAGVPKDLTEKFAIREQRLTKRLETTKQEIANSTKALSDFAEEIITYKTLTVNFSNDVKNSINNIEKRYVVLQKKVTAITSAVKIAEEEMVNVVEQFNNPDAPAVSMPEAPSAEQALEQAEIEDASDAELLQDLAIDSDKAKEEADKLLNKTNDALKDKLSSIAADVPDSDVSDEDIEEAFNNIKSGDVEQVDEPDTSSQASAPVVNAEKMAAPADNALDIAKKSSKLGLKGVFKSVFTSDEPEDNSGLLSEQLKRSITDHEDDGIEDTDDEETISHDESDEERRKRRRRRR